MNSNVAHCLFCDRPIEKKHKNHRFCCRSCQYCYSRGGVPFRDRGWYWDLNLGRLVKPAEEIKKKRKKRAEVRLSLDRIEKESAEFLAERKRKRQEERERKIAEKRERQRRVAKRVGVVYLMESMGYYKIGITTNIRARRKQINKEIPVKVRVVHYFESDYYREVEKYLHEKYWSQNAEREWFELTPEQVEEIKSILDYELDSLIVT